MFCFWGFFLVQPTWHWTKYNEFPALKWLYCRYSLSHLCSKPFLWFIFASFSSISCFLSQSANDSTMVSWGVVEAGGASVTPEDECGVSGATVSSKIRRSCSESITRRLCMITWNKSAPVHRYRSGVSEKWSVDEMYLFVVSPFLFFYLPLSFLPLLLQSLLLLLILLLQGTQTDVLNLLIDFPCNWVIDILPSKF